MDDKCLREYPICWRARLIFREPTTDWRKETTEWSWNWTKANTVIGQCIWLLNISKDREPTAPWGNLCQCFIALTAKWFLMFILSLQFKPTASGPVTGHYQKAAGSILSGPCLQVLSYLDEIPLNPLFSRLNFQNSQPVLVQWMFQLFQSLNHLSGLGISGCPNTRTAALIYGRKYSGDPQIVMKLPRVWGVT